MSLGLSILFESIYMYIIRGKNQREENLEMSVYIVGSGGREHSLALRLHQSIRLISSAPGNAGLAMVGTCFPIAANDLVGHVKLVREHKPELVLIGPEDPLAMGLADLIAQLGVPVFGPSELAAQVEASKYFAKQVMMAAGVPTAKFEYFLDSQGALEYLQQAGCPFEECTRT